jgi:hypothetical protein
MKVQVQAVSFVVLWVASCAMTIDKGDVNLVKKLAEKRAQFGGPMQGYPGGLEPMGQYPQGNQQYPGHHHGPPPYGQQGMQQFGQQYPGNQQYGGQQGYGQNQYYTTVGFPMNLFATTPPFYNNNMNFNSPTTVGFPMNLFGRKKLIRMA